VNRDETCDYLRVCTTDVHYRG